MPEGPEIWRAAHQISKAIQKKEVKEIFFAFDDLKMFEDELKGTEVTRVEPRGKAILTSFSNGMTIYSQNQLYGKWILARRGTTPDTNRSLRLAIHTTSHSALLYSASDIELLFSEKEIEGHKYIQKLGPDVVHPDTTFEEVLARYHDKTYQRRNISTLLLDPGFLSGVGNYLRSEILFCSYVHPDVTLSECSDEQKQQLAEYSLLLSRRSYQTKGVTIDPELEEALKEEGVKRSARRHYAYGRTGKPCYRCGHEIECIVKSGRKIYFCPNEQIR
ncbi:MAG: endonuclease VIII [Bacteroidota bacterium]